MSNKPRIHREMRYDMEAIFDWDAMLRTVRKPRWYVTHPHYAGHYETWEYADACRLAYAMCMEVDR